MERRTRQLLVENQSDDVLDLAGKVIDVETKLEMTRESMKSEGCLFLNSNG